MRLERVLTNDPGIGVARHADAGYESARRDRAPRTGSHLPMAPIACSRARFKPWHVPLFLAKYAWLACAARPVLVHFEVTLRCNARCGFCDYWKTPADAKAHELQVVRRRRALLQSDAGHVHRRRAAAAPRSRGARRRGRRRGAAQVLTLITHGGCSRRSARVAVECGHQPVQHLARLPRRAARRRARHSRAHGEDLRARSTACARAASTTSASTRSSRTTTSISCCRSSSARRRSAAA